MHRCRPIQIKDEISDLVGFLLQQNFVLSLTPVFLEGFFFGNGMNFPRSQRIRFSVCLLYMREILFGEDSVQHLGRMQEEVS